MPCDYAAGSNPHPNDLNETTSLAKALQLVTIQPTPPGGPINRRSSPTPSLGGPCDSAAPCSCCPTDRYREGARPTPSYLAGAVVGRRGWVRNTRHLWRHAGEPTRVVVASTVSVVGGGVGRGRGAGIREWPRCRRQQRGRQEHASRQADSLARACRHRVQRGGLRGHHEYVLPARLPAP